MERNSISLNLGDIIQLTSPSNDSLHNKLFLITYIDGKRLELRDEFTIENLNIIDGEFSDKSIKGIEIIHRSESKGYAEINGLVEGKWINIYFKGDVPFIVVGEIVSKERDMIEIKLHPDESYIYLDFEYSGLKEEYNIDKIELREKPKTLTTKQNDGLNIYEVTRTGEEDIEEKQQPINGENNGEINENLLVEHANNMNEPHDGEPHDGQGEHSNVEFDDLLDNNTLGEDLGFVETTSKVPPKEMRYGLKMQLDDLIGSVINSIELKKRTPMVHKEVQVYVERVTLLREQFSNFDKNGNISNILKKSSNTIISDNILDNNNAQPLWLYYGGVMQRKIYDNNTDGGMFVNSNIITDVNNYLRYSNEYQTTREQKFRTYIDGVINPYISSNDEFAFSIFNSKHDINTIANNNGNLSRTDATGTNVFNTLDRHLSGETVTFDSYITLPVKLFSIQYVNSPNINIMTKIIESGKRKLISNIFNDTNNNIIFKGGKKTVDETNLNQYKHHVKSGKQEDLKELLQRDLPVTSKLIHMNHITKNSERTPLSVNNTINELVKYTINHDNISYDDYISIKNIIYSIKRDFFSFFNKHKRIYNNISRLNQDRYSDIFQKNTFYNYIFDKRKGTQEENDLLTDLLVKTYLREQLIRFDGIDGTNNTNKRQLLQEEPKELDIDENWKKMYKKKHPNSSNKDYYNAFVIFLDKGLIVKPEDIATYSKNDDTTSEFIERQFTNSSFITHANSIDNLRFLTHLISYGNASLVNDNFESMMENYKTYLGSLNGNNENGNSVNYGSGKCEINIKLSKKYISEEELEDDNDKDIQYDKEFDDTYYDAMHIYADEKKNMTNEQFETYLSEKMKEVHNLDEDGALDMAKTIINGKRMISNGDYALLELYDDELVSIRIYKRINRRWVLDEEATSQHMNNFSLLMDGNRCPQTIDCGYDGNISSNGSDCLSTREKREKINKVFVDQMILEFKHVYSKKETELKLLISHMGEKLRRQQVLNNKLLYKHSDKANRISNFYNFQDMSIISPLHSMRDQILGNEDFATKQQEIIMFVNKFLRKPNSSNSDAISENKYMLYCKDTNQAILPLFLYELANAFVGQGGNYTRELERIKNTQGELSDDGGFWVDAKSGSGYKICDIDYSFDEGYTEGGSKITTHAVLEPEEPTDDDEFELSVSELENYEEFKNKLIETTSKDKDENVMFTSTDANDIYTLLSKSENFTGIILENKVEIVIKILNFYNRSPALQDKAEIAKVVLSMAAIVINIQLQIFDISVIRYSGSCIPFIFGFPLYDETNMKTVEFVVCVFKELKLNELINSMKIEEVVTTLKPYIVKLARGEFKSDINRFLTERKTAVEKQVDVQYKGSFNYKLFMPYQGNIKLPSYNPLSTKIKEPYMSFENRMIATSKIIELSYYILYEMHNTVSKEELHFIGNKIHKNNTCCMSNHSTVDAYFRENNRSYDSYIDQSREINNMLNTTRLNSKPNCYYSNENTRKFVPNPSNSYDTILLNDAVHTYRQKYIEQNIIDDDDDDDNDDNDNDDNDNDDNDNNNNNNNNNVSLNNEDNGNKMFQPEKIDTTYIHKKNIVKMDTHINMSLCETLQRRMQDRIDCQLQDKDKDKDDDEDKIAMCVKEDLTPKFENFVDKLHELIKDIPCEGSPELEDKFKSKISKMESYIFNQIQKMKDSITKNLQTLPNVKGRRKTSQKYDMFFDNLKTIFLNWSKNKSDSNPIQLVNTFKIIINIIKIKSFKNFTETVEVVNNPYVVPKHWGLYKNDAIILSDFNKKMDTLHNVNSITQELFHKINIPLNEHISWINTFSLPKDLKHMEIYIYIYSILYLLYIIQENIDTITNADCKLNSKIFLNSLIERLLIEFKNQTINFEQIMDKTLRSKEREKDQMTAKLKGMNDDEGEVDEFLRLHKLGKWGKGLQKSLFVYDARTQEEERKQFTGQEQEEREQEEQEQEEADLSNLGEDGEDLSEE